MCSSDLTKVTTESNPGNPDNPSNPPSNPPGNPPQDPPTDDPEDPPATEPAKDPTKGPGHNPATPSDMKGQNEDKPQDISNDQGHQDKVGQDGNGVNADEVSKPVVTQPATPAEPVYVPTGNATDGATPPKTDPLPVPTDSSYVETTTTTNDNGDTTTSYKPVDVPNEKAAEEIEIAD